jgi:hypothetical protein
MAIKKFMPLTHFVAKQNGEWPTIMVWFAGHLSRKDPPGGERI